MSRPCCMPRAGLWLPPLPICCMPSLAAHLAHQCPAASWLPCHLNDWAFAMLAVCFWQRRDACSRLAHSATAWLWCHLTLAGVQGACTASQTANLRGPKDSHAVHTYKLQPQGDVPVQHKSSALFWPGHGLQIIPQLLDILGRPCHRWLPGPSRVRAGIPRMGGYLKTSSACSASMYQHPSCTQLLAAMHGLLYMHHACLRLAFLCWHLLVPRAS